MPLLNENEVIQKAIFGGCPNCAATVPVEMPFKAETGSSLYAWHKARHRGENGANREAATWMRNPRGRAGWSERVKGFYLDKRDRLTKSTRYSSTNLARES
jgi:hypothetical protein